VTLFIALLTLGLLGAAFTFPLSLCVAAKRGDEMWADLARRERKQILEAARSDSNRVGGISECASRAASAIR
jgi:hypothetical protein